MSTWNYRVMEFPPDEAGEIVMGIFEVYYDDDGNPRNYSYDPAPVYWNGAEGGVEIGNDVINLMLEAINKPVLKPSDFPNGRS